MHGRNKKCSLYKILIRKPGGKNSLERRKHRWTDLKEGGCGSAAGFYQNSNIPYISIKDETLKC
jgi:hypothetical protein